MSLLGALGEELVLFAFSLVLMQASLRRGRLKGLFAALPVGLLPALALAGLAFWQLQQKDLPEMRDARQAYVAQVEHMAATAYPKPEDGADRDAFRELWSKFFEVSPAIEFCFHLGILAALAVLLRRRYAKAGLMPEAEPLSRWTAPWTLSWLVLGPAFVLVGAAKGLFEIEDLWQSLAWNLLVVGLSIFLFQGMVVAAAKLKAWWLDPRTRALVFLVLAGVFASFLVQAGRGLLAFLLFTGLFEPWMDARRLRQAPPSPGRKP
jgi:hypothetical protein